MGLEQMLKAPRPAGVLWSSSADPVVILLLLMLKLNGRKKSIKLLWSVIYESNRRERGFRKRMLETWNEIGMFSLTEQQLAGQVLCIRNGKYLTELEIEEIRRKINEPTQIEAEEEQIDNHVDPINDSGAMESIDNRENRQANLETDLDTEGPSGEQGEILKMLKEKLRQPENLQPVNLRTMDRRKVKEKTANVNKIIDRIPCQNIGDTNKLILAGANVVAELLGKQKKKQVEKQSQPWWKRRI